MQPKALLSSLPTDVLSALLDRAFDGIAILEQARIIYVNAGLAKMFGRTAEEMVGQPADAFAVPGSVSLVRDSVRSREDRTYVAEAYRKDGQIICAEIRSFPYVCDGRSLRFSMMRDITADRAAQDKLAELRTQMLLSSQTSALAEMANSIAHEINNPLSVIRAYTDVLRESILGGVLLRGEDPSEERQRFVAHVDKIDLTVHRITQIVRSLAAFTRGDHRMPFQSVSFAGLVRDTLSLCEARFRSAGVSLECSSLPEGTKIQCRPVPISQVLLNLLYNAADAVEGRSSAWVRVSVQELPSEVRLKIEDSGPGIPKQDRHRVMAAFYTTKPEGQGTGLGLAISRKIVESHRGTLTFDVDAPHTTFVVTLPKTQG